MRLLPVRAPDGYGRPQPATSRAKRVEGSGGTSVGDDHEAVRQRLLSRREDCFQRIDDAISELLALHDVSGDEVRDHVEACILREKQSAP